MSIKNHKVLVAERKGEMLIVTPQGDAVGFRDSDVEKELQALLDVLDAAEGRDLLVDLSHDNYFGSVIIGAFVALGRKALEKKRRAALCSVSQQMDQTLKVMNLDTLWEQYSTRKQALKAL